MPSFAYNPATGRFRMRDGKFMLASNCGAGIMVIFYEWADLGSSRDLDTQTAFLGESVGWRVGDRKSTRLNSSH